MCVPPASAWSLNSTDPKSPFYDPSLEGMHVEREGKGMEREGKDLVGLARDVAYTAMERDFFGIGRLVSESGLVKDMRKIMVENYAV